MIGSLRRLLRLKPPRTGLFRLPAFHSADGTVRVMKRLLFIAAAPLVAACGAPTIVEPDTVPQPTIPAVDITVPTPDVPDVDVLALVVDRPSRPTAEDLDPDGDEIAGSTTPVDLNDDGTPDEFHIDTNLDGTIDEIRLPDGPDGATVTLGGVDPVDWTAQSPDAWTVNRDVESDNGIDAVHVGLDTNGDGTPDMTAVDTDGDGRIEQIEHDRDRDGTVDFICINHDFDASDCEETWEDTDGDGEMDRNMFDSDLDGVLEEVDLSVWEPIWKIVECPDLDGDDIEDICHLDWDGDGVADSSVDLVVFWPEEPVDFDNDGIPDPNVLFATPPEELVNPLD